MTLATLAGGQILRLPFPSYHKPLDAGAGADPLRDTERQGRRPSRCSRDCCSRYPHVLAIGQELVLALMECGEHERAEQVLMELETRFTNLDEETLCRWGRLFKDRGDRLRRPPLVGPDRSGPDPELAGDFYRRSLEKYDQAYRIRFGHYPGINKATLLLILGSLKPPGPGSGPPPRSCTSRRSWPAGCLANRRAGRREQPDDPTVWHPATAGEAHLLRREWAEAAAQYREALKSRDLTPTPARRCAGRSSGSCCASAP